jgi:serine/threonine protein kinase
MLVTCPRCKRSLSADASEGPPAFCMYCGQKLRETVLSSGGMLTASHVPFTDNPEVDVAEPPPAEVGGYRLIRFLGAGGMGAVYEAEAPESGNRVAVKLLSSRLASNPASVERFRQEGRLASQLTHPRSVFVLAADTDAGRPYIIMELMPGRTLKDVVDANGPLPPNEALAYILDALDGLAEAHRLGMIHRDVKPSNCFLTADDRVKIGDFGLSKSLGDSRDRHLTQSGTFLGTVLFASPEQIRGEPLSYASDIYSLCATLYYLLCGTAPYHHESATAALAKAISEPPPSICEKRTDVPRAVERLVMRGLERDPDRRWQSLEDLREAIVDLLPARQTPARPRAIIGAYILDYMLLLLVLELPYELLRSAFEWPDPEFLGVDLKPVSWALSTAYFATLEGTLGRTPGKSLLGLRVSRVGQSGPPGLARGWLRATVFAAIWFWTFHAPGITANVGGGLEYATLVSGLAVLALQFRRTFGGYRGVHDFLSGCHVTQKPLRARRLRLQSRAANPMEELLPPNEAEPLPATVGGYAVKGRLWAEPLGEQLWLAEDRALSRRVLLWVLPDDGNPATPLPSDVPRLTRLRRLGRGNFTWANRALEWVAFAAPAGAPLANTIRKPIAWADTRHLLEQLVDELQASQTDGSLPAKLGVQQVWVEPNGRLQLLDFPLPQAPSDCDSFGLLRSVASLTLEGAARAGTAPGGVHAPVPPHAAPIFTKLFAPKGYERLGDLSVDLRETHAHSPEVTPAIRTAHLGIQAVALAFGLWLMFGAAFLVGTVLVIAANGRRDTAEIALRDLANPAKHEELKKIQGAAGAIGNPKAIARIEQLRDRLRVEAGERREALLAPQRLLLDAYEQALAGGQRNETQQLRLEREILVWSAAHEKSPAGSGASPWKYELGPFWIILAAVPLIWIAAAAVMRGGFSMLLTGIAVVRSDGRRATRRQCAFRAALVWLPVTLLLAASMWVQIAHYRWPYLGAGLWFAAAMLLPVYFVLALKFPTRPPQDRLAGTHLMPA